MHKYPVEETGMRIKIVGGSQKKRELVKMAVKWGGQKIIRPRINKNIYIRIRIRGGLYRDDNTLGECIWQDGDHIRPRRFEMDLESSQGAASMIQTALHETVHVKQWAHGNLMERMRGHKQLWLWNGVDRTDSDWNTAPWEVEARNMETELFNDFVEENEIDFDHWDWPQRAFRSDYNRVPGYLEITKRFSENLFKN